jgi:hypothetical protein
MLSQKQLNKLEKAKAIQKLKNREERYAYLGLLSEYQLHPKNLIQNLEYTKLNPYQHYLFKRILHGLNMYTKDEVNFMHWDKKRRISKVWKRGQDVINELKQYVCYQKSNSLFSIFAKSEAGQQLLNQPFEYLPDYNNKMSLKELDLKYEDIIIKFMQEGLLPKNFLLLKSDPNEKGIKKNGSDKQRIHPAKKTVSKQVSNVSGKNTSM